MHFDIVVNGVYKCDLLTEHEDTLRELWSFLISLLNAFSNVSQRSLDLFV